jgi:hypothetical protein
MKNKPLSASAKNRLVRQGMAHIAALEKASWHMRLA